MLTSNDLSLFFTVKLVFCMQERFFLSLSQRRGEEELLLLPM